MTRSLLALTALLFSFTFTIIEAPVTHVVKASALSQPELSIENVYSAPQQTEKHFLPVDEVILTHVHFGFMGVVLLTAAYHAHTTELNNRGPPAILS